MGLRAFMPMVIACPGCGTTSTYFQQLAQDIQSYLREQMPLWRKQYPGVEEMDVAVMGCVVNGPGEANANIGISLPGTGEHPAAPSTSMGQKTVTPEGRQHRRRSSRRLSTTMSAVTTGMVSRLHELDLTRYGT